MGKCKEGLVEVTVTNVNPRIKLELKAVAKSQGKTVSDLLRPVFREIINKCPESIRLEYLKDLEQ